MPSMVDYRCPEMSRIGKGRPKQIRPTSKEAAPADQLDLRFSRIKKVTAFDEVKAHLLDVLPPGVPPSYKDILSAEYVGSGRKRTAVAELVMFDGERAVVEVFWWGSFDSVKCYGHRWLVWNGPAAYFEGGEWKRDTEADHQPIFTESSGDHE